MAERDRLAEVIAAALCCGGTPEQHPQFAEGPAHVAADAALAAGWSRNA